MPATRLLLPLLLWLATPATARDPAAGLGALDRLVIEVVASADHPDVAADELRRRVEAALRAGRPALAVEPGGSDVLRLSVALDRVSATELRGFYLPFSGFYGLGAVRLAVERAVIVPGVAGPVRAVVWEAERPVRLPWHRSGTGIIPLVDALVARFLEDYRRAVAP